MYEADEAHLEDSDMPKTGPLTIRLRISCPATGSRRRAKPRELEITLLKPIRLGRMDPFHDTYPEVDLTDELAIEQGVSREHACIFRRGNTILVEDLGSTNGTLLNGERLAPYLPVPLKQGDQLQLGKLPIEVLIETYPSHRTDVKAKVSAGVPPRAGKTRGV
jgi:pSer/pThr/pTyr-binding forkhead associated (FHA) protein